MLARDANVLSKTPLQEDLRGMDTIRMMAEIINGMGTRLLNIPAPGCARQRSNRGEGKHASHVSWRPIVGPYYSIAAADIFCTQTTAVSRRRSD